MDFAFSTTFEMFSSVAGDSLFFMPISDKVKCLKSLKPAFSRVFLAQFKGHPSITIIKPADSVVAIMPLTRPPIPARQVIFSAPSFVSFRAAKSVIAPVSEHPEQANISVGALQQEHESFSFIINPLYILLAKVLFDVFRL
jgi:hypothetical protein